MERGLLWLPLLAAFIWLAWSGWNEFQKIEAYRRWATEFERAKYDIYAVLGQKGSDLTWGKPTRQGPVNLETFSLKDVQSLRLLVGQQSADLDTLLENGRKISVAGAQNAIGAGTRSAIALEFLLKEPATSIKVPFTEIPLAAEWGKYLQQELQRLRLEPTE
ncbi:MAG TPA: hypothetical protein DCP31_21785 [Cyanobacteria bacterium UBA8543]|nr:hypothetical protein [Cyanobacteria bacterium UBA8543]